MNTRPLRVAHVTLQLDIGGMEKLLAEFARHTDRRRAHLHFVSLGGRGPVAEEIEACGWDVTTLDKGAGLKAGLVFRLAKLFRRWGVDVVHTHNNAPFLYAAPAARLAGVPCVVHTRHGRSFGASRRQTGATRLASLFVDRVVCVSEDSARLSAEEGIPRRKVRRLWNGIDLARFAYLGPQEGGPVVMVARLSPEKDAATLVRAAALAVRAEPSFRLEIAGDGACLPSLRALTTELGLDAHVRFHGAVRDVPALLARASAFVLPSISEGVSLTLLEAMARGLPVVATRVGGTPEVVLHEQTGLLVPPGDPAALAERLVSLLRDPARGRQLGLAGRRRVEESFSVTAMLRQYEELYHQVLRRRIPA